VTARIVPIGGLGNRIRAILSYRSVHGEIEVLWARSPAVCGGRWDDAFEPLRGVTFTDIGTGHAHDYVGDATVTYEQVKSDAREGWTRGYAELEPRPHVHARESVLCSMLGGAYGAIHARRGDHVEHSKLFGHHTTNEELLSVEMPGPLYLATDCPETQQWFRNRSSRILVNRDAGHTGPGYEQRQGSLTDAAVDLFVCAGAAMFKGSWMSSFSETIELIRCGGEPEGGFALRRDMPSGDAEFFRGRPDRAKEAIAERGEVRRGWARPGGARQGEDL
jgi:hypothetical protein